MLYRDVNMRVYTGKGLGDFYYSLIRDITNKGREVLVKGKGRPEPQRRLEMPHPVVLVYSKPDACWMNIPGRKFNPFFALAEIIWILAGNGNAHWISYYNSIMMESNDGDPENHGAYGTRLRKWPNYGGDPFHPTPVDQIEQVLEKLTEDPYSTQAVMTLWDPVRDNLKRSKDYPCNNWVQYTLRDGVLDQAVVIRSNDLILGTPVNAIQFGHLLAYMAGRLDVKVGTLTYFVGNLHYYLDLYPPKLGNLINLAFEGDGYAEPGAIACDWDMRAVDERKFQLSKSRVEYLRRWVDAPDEHTPTSAWGWGDLNQGSYWEYAIPEMVRIFTLVKSHSQRDYDEDVKKLPYPFPQLAIDFWQGSKNPVAQSIVESLWDLRSK